MKKTLNRSLSLLLALVLAVSLAVPALAADEPVTLDQTKALPVSQAERCPPRHPLQRVSGPADHLEIQRHQRGHPL